MQWRFALSLSSNDQRPELRFRSARTVCQAVRDNSISAAEYVQELIAACRDNQALNDLIELDEARVLALAKERRVIC